MQVRFPKRRDRIQPARQRPGAAALWPALTLAAFAIPALAQNVASYEIVDAREIPASLTGDPGDPLAGRKLYFDRKLTRCAMCHGSPDKMASGAAGQGDPNTNTESDDVPSLAGVAARLTEGAIRLWLVAPEVIAPGTEMPGYYLVGQRDDPADPRYGEPWLNAAQIEDLVSFLMQQTGRPEQPAPR